jgi:Peptidase family M28
MRSTRSVWFGLVLAFAGFGGFGGVGFSGAVGAIRSEVPSVKASVQNPVQNPVQDPSTQAEATIRLPPPDPTIAALVGRLDLDRYKANIKGLTVFGDRRQGTKRNRDAVDWIETQLRDYGCTNTERITYTYTTPARRGGGGGGQRPTPPGQGEPLRTGPGGSTEFGNRAQTGVASLPDANGAARGAGAGAGADAGGAAGGAAAPADPVGRAPQAEIDARHRALNAEPSTDGERQEVYCTKIGTTHPNEMYIVGGHMDGIGWGEAANDDGSGAALVMQLARIFSSPDVTTDRSIRFILWNNEESGLNGSRAYVEQRKDLQGKEVPAGSGRYPEPTWLGMIQHDMMLWDHGMPQPMLDASGQPMRDAQGRVIYHAPKDQRPEADVNIEFQSISKMADGSQKLAWAFKFANDRYATTYPAQVGPHMTNTDSAPFQDLVPAISLRENERGRDIQAGWDPNWHQPTDVYTTYSDKDFTLGLNAAQTTLAGVAQLAGATIKK